MNAGLLRAEHHVLLVHMTCTKFFNQAALFSSGAIGPESIPVVMSPARTLSWRCPLTVAYWPAAHWPPHPTRPANSCCPLYRADWL